MHILAMVNQKGGVGKTAMTVELAAALGARGRHTVVVDLDPQGTATAGTLGPERAPYGTADLLLGRRSLHDALQPCAIPNVEIVASLQNELATAEQTLAARGVDGYLALAEAIDERAADVLLCDCPPNLSILTGCALASADGVLVPVDSTQARVAIGQLERTITGSRRLNADLRVLGAILTRFVAQQRLSQERREALNTNPFFPATWPVRPSNGFERAFRAGRALRDIANSPGEHAAVREVDAIAADLEAGWSAA